MSAQSSGESFLCKLDCILNIEFLIFCSPLKVVQCQLALLCDCWVRSWLYEITGDCATGFVGTKVSPKLLYLYPFYFVLS